MTHKSFKYVLMFGLYSTMDAFILLLLIGIIK